MVQTVHKTIEIPQVQCSDKVVDDPVVQVMEKTVEIPQLQIVEKIVDAPEIQTVQGTESFESFGTAPVHQVAQEEIVEAVEIGAHLLAESGPPMFVGEPALEAPVVVYVQSTLVAECMATRSEHRVGLPRVQYNDKVGNVPVVMQRTVLIVHSVQKAMNVEGVMLTPKGRVRHYNSKQQPDKQAAQESEEGKREKGEEERMEERKS